MYHGKMHRAYNEHFYALIVERGGIVRLLLVSGDTWTCDVRAPFAENKGK